MKNYPLYPIDYYTDFASFIDGIGKKYAEKPAISWFTRKKEEKGVTYGQLREQVFALQDMLRRKGLAGKHLAILGENCYEWLLAYFAAVSCGSLAVCVDTEQSDETIHQMLAMADSDAVFVSSQYLDICQSFEDKKIPIFLLNGAADGCETVASLVEQGEKYRKEGKALSPRDGEVSPEKTAVIVFTSGTTSLPKPVMLTHGGLLTNASDADATVLVGDRVFTALPFYHTYGMGDAVLAMLIKGAHLYINGNLKLFSRDLHLAKPHTMLTVPLILESIHNQIWLAAEQAGKADGLRKLLKLQKLKRGLGFKKTGRLLSEIREKAVGTLELAICGGAHMPKDIMEEFELLGVTVLQGYGITECSPLVCVNRNHANKLDSVGVVMPHTEIRIEDGEILVRGINVMAGYYKHPELTEEVMSGEWFRTGDVGEIDKDGFLSITGRKKNLVVFKNGKKVSPEKLEEKIKKIPLVKDVVVYGAASGVSADDVKLAASIYPDPERTGRMTSYEILEELQSEIDVINDGLPLYQQIQMVNIREQEFSKTSMQKIKRYV